MKPSQLDIGRIALRERRTKILATVGPASASPEKLEALIGAGVNVFRLNFSHGNHEGHEEVYGHIRSVSERLGCSVAILGDLCGPKMRCGHFENDGIELIEDETVVVTVRNVLGKAGLIPSEYKELANDVESGDRILMDDGRRELVVNKVVDGTDIECTVVHGGWLSNRKGINLPGVKISAPALTEKDKRDARFAARLGVDYLALSFVRFAEDIDLLASLLEEEDTHIPIIAKIEKPEALSNIDDIMDKTAGIMVARGDLGVEMPAEEVPLLQQALTQRAIERNRLVIVATQMLESMISNARPTRAEVTDVAWAAMAGADAVMLSGETAVGEHPVEAVSTMNRVLRLVEGHQWHTDQFEHLVVHASPSTDQPTTTLQLSEALSRAAAKLARELKVRAIVVRSHTGLTARMIAAERPSSPIVAVTSRESTCRRLSLVWGVTPHVVGLDEISDLITLAPRVARQLELARRSDFILLITGGVTEKERSAPGIRILMT